MHLHAYVESCKVQDILETDFLANIIFSTKLIALADKNYIAANCFWESTTLKNQLYQCSN